MRLSYGLLPLAEVDLESDIEALNFSTRVYNGLKRNNINTVEELIALGVVKTSRIEAIGDDSIAHIKRVLGCRNLSWEKQFIKRQDE